MTPLPLTSMNTSFSFASLPGVDYGLLCILTLEANHYVIRRIEMQEEQFVI